MGMGKQAAKSMHAFLKDHIHHPPDGSEG
jgi:hypothetical protein